MRNFRFQRIDLLAAVFAVAIVAVGFRWVEAFKVSAPASHWFEVYDVYVPDFVEGDDPPIIYDKVVRKPFVGEWVADIRPFTEGTPAAVCVGSGTSHYAVEEQAKENPTLEWYIGKDCKLPPGTYTMSTVWEVRPEGYPTKYVEKNSNVFTVFPRGSQMFLTPEQVQKLESAP